MRVASAGRDWQFNMRWCVGWMYWKGRLAWETGVSSGVDNKDGAESEERRSGGAEQSIIRTKRGRRAEGRERKAESGESRAESRKWSGGVSSRDEVESQEHGCRQQAAELVAPHIHHTHSYHFSAKH